MSRQQPRSVAELRPVAQHYLDSYTDPAGLYAFATYDLADVRGGPLTASDVLMANLLGLRLGWRDVVPLFADTDSAPSRLRRALDAALAEARDLPPLEDCDDAQVKMPALRDANELAYQTMFPGQSRRTWTAVTVSKVLHRLSRNVPLVDSTVRKFYGSQWAGTIRERMRDDLARNRSWLAELAARHDIHGNPMPLTRAADILIWMDAQARPGQ
jgi:hypothetical protein